MILLEVTSPGNVSLVLFFGTIGMLALTIGLIIFIIFHQRKVIRYQMSLQKMEDEQQKILLNASIRLQEEERQRLAADLHDDARSGRPPSAATPPMGCRSSRRRPSWTASPLCHRRNQASKSLGLKFRYDH